MLPKVVKIELPRNAKHEDVVKAVNSKLTRRTTDVLRKSQNVVLAIFATFSGVLRRGTAV